MTKIKFTKKEFEEAVNPVVQDGDTGESEEKKKLKDTIDQISDEYKTAPNRTYGDITIPNTVEKTYEMPSDEETYKRAESEVSPLYNAKIQSLTSESAMAQQNVEDEKDELYERAEESLKQLNKTYNGSKENASNEALKRGLARSSIILNQLSDLEQARLNATGGVLTQRDKDLSGLTRQIDNLKLKLLNDTNILNEEKVKEINQRVEELLEKYRQEEKDVMEYNNKLRLEKAESLAKLKEAGIVVDETDSKEYATMISNKTKAFYSYYYSLGKNALSELQGDRQYVVDNIGEAGYQNLVRYFS